MPKDTICNKQITSSVCILIEKGMTISKIADVLKPHVAKSTLYNWLDESSEFYQHKFAMAVKEARERYDTGQVKAGQIEQAEKHVLLKTIRELKQYDIRTLGNKVVLPKGAKRIKGKPKPPPNMPPMSFSVREHIVYARKFLDLVIKGKMTKANVRMLCQERIDELSVDTMVKVRTEEQQVDPNQQAVKNVLTNMGPEKERWAFRDEKDLNLKGEIVIQNVVFGSPEKK